MEKVKVLLGSFTFLEPRPNLPFVEDMVRTSVADSYTAIIHRIDKEAEVLLSDLDDFCENSLETYEGYLIPSIYNGVIQNSL